MHAEVARVSVRPVHLVHHVRLERPVRPVRLVRIERPHASRAPRALARHTCRRVTTAHKTRSHEQLIQQKNPGYLRINLKPRPE